MAASRTTPRLRLDAASSLASATPPHAIAAIATPAPSIAPDIAGPQLLAAQAAADAASAALGHERERLQSLEAGFARLHRDSEAQQKTLAELQARLRQAEGERYANGLVYALSGGLVFFALLSAAKTTFCPAAKF